MCAKKHKTKHQTVFVTVCLQKNNILIISTLQVSHRLFCDCFHKFFCVTFTQIEKFPMHSHLNSLTNKFDCLFKQLDASFVRKSPNRFFLLTISTTFWWVTSVTNRTHHFAWKWLKFAYNSYSHQFHRWASL